MKAKGVPFVVTYHPKLKDLSKIIKDNLYLLYMNDEVKKTFTSSSYKCGKKRCEVCDVFLRLIHFLALLPVKVLKLIIGLIVVINASCT